MMVNIYNNKTKIIMIILVTTMTRKILMHTLRTAILETEPRSFRTFAYRSGWCSCVSNRMQDVIVCAFAAFSLHKRHFFCDDLLKKSREHERLAGESTPRFKLLCPRDSTGVPSQGGLLIILWPHIYTKNSRCFDTYLQRAPLCWHDAKKARSKANIHT